MREAVCGNKIENKFEECMRLLVVWVVFLGLQSLKLNNCNQIAFIRIFVVKKL